VGDLIDVSPSFVNPLLGNYHLQPGSLAIDQGSAVGAPGADFDGQARPAGAGYDIGADEYVAFTSFVYLPIVFKNDTPARR